MLCCVVLRVCLAYIYFKSWEIGCAIPGMFRPGIVIHAHFESVTAAEPATIPASRSATVRGISPAASQVDPGYFARNRSHTCTQVYDWIVNHHKPHSFHSEAK